MHENKLLIVYYFRDKMFPFPHAAHSNNMDKNPKFIVVAILQVLREAAHTGGVTAGEIVDRLEYPIDFYDTSYLHYLRNPPQSRGQLVEMALNDCARIGMVHSSLPGEGQAADGALRWTLSPEWFGPGGGDAPPPDQRRGGDDGGTGGMGGMREVLAHRYLFSLSQDDFSAALDTALASKP